MEACILGLVASCSPTAALQAGPLRMVPLRCATPQTLPVEPALRLDPRDELRLSERDEDARVEEIQAFNPTAREVLLLEGELLAGGYQDRMVAASALVRRRSAGMLATACSEEGRFEGDDPLLRPTGQVAPPRYRRRLRRGAFDIAGGPRTRQKALWDDIESDRGTLGLPGSGLSLARLLAAAAGPAGDLAAALDRGDDPDTGWMFFMDDRFLAGDLFADPTLAAAYRPALSRAAAFDVLLEGMRRGPAPIPDGGARTRPIPSGRWEEMGAELERALAIRQETATGAARILFESPALAGTALVEGGQPLHISFYPAVYPEDLAPLA